MFDSFYKIPFNLFYQIQFFSVNNHSIRSKYTFNCILLTSCYFRVKLSNIKIVQVLDCPRAHEEILGSVTDNILHNCNYGNKTRGEIRTYS